MPKRRTEQIPDVIQLRSNPASCLVIGCFQNLPWRRTKHARSSWPEKIACQSIRPPWIAINAYGCVYADRHNVLQGEYKLAELDLDLGTNEAIIVNNNCDPASPTCVHTGREPRPHNSGLPESDSRPVALEQIRVLTSPSMDLECGHLARPIAFDVTPPKCHKVGKLLSRHPTSFALSENGDKLFVQGHSADNDSRISIAIALANPTGTALPICRAISVLLPHHTKSSGNPWIRAASQ